jgi:hypothetical protein
MKKLMILFLGLTLFACQRGIIPVKSRSATVSLTDVNIGTTANDGTGDALRTAFQKVNANNALIEAAIATTSTTTEVRGIVNDSIDALKELAVPLSSVAFLRADADEAGEAVTYEGMVNYVAANGGTGGGGGYEYTSFIVGTTTGAPSNADTAFTISDMAGDVIELYRGTTADLHKQWLNETATNGKTGYRYNSSGQIVVRPAWATNDRAYIKAVPSSGVKKVKGPSSLLTGLRAYWPMNETTGTQVNDYLDTYDGTTTAVVGSSGKFGYGEQFIAANDDMASFGTTVGDVGTSDFSIACWVYVTTGFEAEQGIMGNWGSTPYYYLESLNQKALFYWNFGSGAQELTANAVIPTGEWVSLVVTVDRSGNALMYVNGTVQTDVEDVSEDVAVAGNNNNIFNVGSLGSNNTTYNAGFHIDEPAIWLKVLTQEEVTELQTSAVN